MARKYIRDNRGRFAHTPGTIAPISGRHKFGPLTIDTKPPASFRRSSTPGFPGLKKNFKPYIRVNKRSTTIGYATGTRIAGKQARLVTGRYIRVEGTGKLTTVDKAVNRVANRAFPKGSKRSTGLAAFRNHVHISTPAVRAQFGQSATNPRRKGVQFRLGTARPYGKSRTGPTLVITRGTHKTSWDKSFKGMQKYDNRMSQIAGKKAGKVKNRRQRRR